MKIDEISPLKKFNDFTKNEGIIQPKFSQDEDFKQNLQMNRNSLKHYLSSQANRFVEGEEEKNE